MTTKITWLGHSSFQIETAGKTILLDPFFTGNPSAILEAATVEADAIIVSHGHGDHVGDTVDIAKRTGALVIANFEIIEWMGKQGIENVHPQHIGGAHQYDFGTVKLTIAHHGSMLPDGSNGGSPCGILLKLDGGTIYFAADTGLFYDMKLIGEEGIDLAILPIGDNFTMGPADSVKATKLIQPKRVLPMHYNTWPLIEQDASAWADQIRGQTAAEPVVLDPGGSCSL
ncbi:metal-dependent hydrolase [Gimesia sp.]|uniref:metal-dependent hydrolase n=1 Tax=Gimesia sp. TaxID=2024833 RepID=UPI000C4A29E2|nr:metal-dependent hydrolase [Gimesia sp.]MAX35406.1 metal-dependent hydrolase [Gimesia sp.]HAH43488.1 metal-dependent hydrolase [Planctomycetaceae bacterium]|tara:strand:- start:25170 stop:25853 length:684 start_codon:yes stop_codon:yes gene_type:complete